MANNKESDGGALTGAAIGASLPMLAHADYEMRQLPQHRQGIKDLIAQALRDKSLHLVAHGDRKNPLRKSMQLGDLIAQSHPSAPIKSLLQPGADRMTAASLLGSGSAYPHVGMSTSNGRSSNMGDANKMTPQRSMLSRAIKALREGKSPLDAIRSVDVFRAPGKIPKNVPSALGRLSSDAFLSDFDDLANVSVVRRNANIAAMPTDELSSKMLEGARAPYSKSRAALSGIGRLAIPYADKIPGGLMKGKEQALGTFCSDGICKIMGKESPAGWSSMPHTLMDDASKLVGVGVNRAALANADKGLRGTSRLASAAGNTMQKTLRQAANLRRGAAGGMTALLAGAGALIGANGDD